MKEEEKVFFLKFLASRLLWRDFTAYDGGLCSIFLFEVQSIFASRLTLHRDMPSLVLTHRKEFEALSPTVERASSRSSVFVSAHVLRARDSVWRWIILMAHKTHNSIGRKKGNCILFGGGEEKNDGRGVHLLFQYRSVIPSFQCKKQAERQKRHEEVNNTTYTYTYRKTKHTERKTCINFFFYST